MGAGPAGLFAALELISLGLKPIVIERGKDVQGRRRDLKAITIHHKVNPDSNYCFGEGGAGTYSDGKLYTRSKKRGDVQRVMDLLVAFGASPDILVDAHPHIGTNKLPKIIEQMRETIRQQGGEVRFETRMTEVLVEAGRAVGIRCQTGEELRAEAVLLATGHSARDVFRVLHQQGILIEAKPFALGVRAEHPQAAIDRIQYRCETRGEFLPPAPYSLVKQVDISCIMTHMLVFQIFPCKWGKPNFFEIAYHLIFIPCKLKCILIIIFINSLFIRFIINKLPTKKQ